MWVPKLLLSPVKIRIFCPKRPKLAFWSSWARPRWLIWCPVGGLVEGFAARAVSRKTPIYFIIDNTDTKNVFGSCSLINIICVWIVFLLFKICCSGPRRYRIWNEKMDSNLNPITVSLPAPAHLVGQINVALAQLLWSTPEGRCDFTNLKTSILQFALVTV